MALARTLALLGVLVALTAASAARADQAETAADLVCSPQGDVAIIRFGIAWNDNPPKFRVLPQPADGALSSKPPTKRTECMLRNGRRIRIRIGDQQSFAYGAGGADPPSFFSLWIDGRVVLSRREWKPGYNAEGPWIAGVVIRGNRLTVCRGPHEEDDEGAPKAPLTCSDERFDLAKARIDRVEYPPTGHRCPSPGTFLLAAGSRDPALCRRFLKGVGNTWNKLLQGQNKTPFDLDLHMQNLETRGTDGTRLSVTTARLRPTGPPYRIAIFSDERHYIDGDMVVIAPARTPDSEIARLRPSIEETILEPPPPGWGYVSGGRIGIYPRVSSRYVHLMFVQIDGVVHLLAHPTNQSETPAAMLLSLESDLKPRPACAFDQVGPNFG